MFDLLNRPILFIIFLLLFASCKKNNEVPGSQTPNSISTDTTTHVYIIGSIGTPTSFSAGFWQDGVLKNISPDPSKNSGARCLTLNDTNVYIGGYTSGDIGTYWVNGNPHYLNNGALNGVIVNAIGFKGSDFYLGGWEINGLVSNYSVPCFWKNNSKFDLNINTYQSGGATGFAFNGNDIYISGVCYDSNGNPYPVFWKNGVLQTLPTDVASANTNTTGIIFVGNDLYIVGYTNAANGNQVATYWKNGVENKLTDSSINAAINCITSSGSDIYMGGVISRSVGTGIATYWKNGNANYLNSNINGSINSVCVNKGDIYYGGYISNNPGYYTPCFWKNNNLHSLTNDGPISIVYCIAVRGGQ